MENYQPNSDKAREQAERRAKPVIDGHAQRKKRALGDFIVSDAQEVFGYLWKQMLVPTIKRTMLDVLYNGASMFLGESSPAKGQRTSGGGLPYYNYSDRRAGNTAAYNDYRVANSNGYRYDDILFGTRGEAEEVLMAMRNMSAQTGYVSVGDLCDMSRVQSNYTDFKYGWTDISDARVDRVGNGYIIRLPRPIYL